MQPDNNAQRTKAGRALLAIVGLTLLAATLLSPSPGQRDRGGDFLCRLLPRPAPLS